MTPQQANKAVGEDPCNSCPEYQPRQVCAKRLDCKAWERYCFRRKVVEAARRQDGRYRRYSGGARWRSIPKTS